MRVRKRRAAEGRIATGRSSGAQPAGAGRRGADGFLLVEALATLAISAFILVGVASVLSLMLRTGDRTAMHAEKVENLGRAVAALERELRLVARVRWAGAARTDFVFQGGPDTLLFARDVGQADGLSTPVLVALQSVGTGAGAQVLRAEAPLLPGATSLADVPLGRPEELYRGRSSVRFAYVGKPTNAEPEIVADSWPSTTRLPSAILVEFADPAAGSPAATLRIPLLIEAEPGCAVSKDAFCSLRDPTEEDEAASEMDDPAGEEDSAGDAGEDG